MLLVIGCTNVSILLLARGTARQHELAVRAAIGGSRFRLVQQLLTGSLGLSILGALLGAAIAYESVSRLVAWLPENSFPHEAAIRMIWNRSGSAIFTTPTFAGNAIERAQTHGGGPRDLLDSDSGLNSPMSPLHPASQRETIGSLGKEQIQ
jgi:hypothetical protein